MIYKQQSYLPIIFQVDEGIINKTGIFLRRNKLSFSNVLVVSGTSFSRRFALELAQVHSWSSYVLENNTFHQVEILKEFVNKENIDLIIAVGGGKVIDSIKRVSYLTNINALVIPTIISNDGLISPVCVLRGENGKTESIPGLMPMGVIIDLDIINSSPLDYIRAAAGDLLSNISATNDWVMAMNKGKERMNDIAFHLSRSAANSIVFYKDINLKDKQFIRQVIQGQINSGIAMSLAGTSRPCSGSEHLISHALDFLGISDTLHGIQVASISLFTLFLQRKLRPEYMNYAKATGIPLNFMDKFPSCSNDLFNSVLNKAREMRPGRHTILTQLTNDEIKKELINFRDKLNMEIL